ncbi:MAG: IS110 family transposase [Candidatus Zixiibacteriota bacterium]
MKKTQETLRREDSTKEAVLHLAFELSNTKWKLAFSDCSKRRLVTIRARNLEELQEEIEKAKLRFKLSDDVRVVSCYEAGRDGFWLHRYLLSCGVENKVVDSSSIEVNRRKRRAKTDRIDAGKLLRMLMRYHAGERKLWSVVRVPSVEAEDGRSLNRELEALNKEGTMNRSRIRGLLIREGLQVGNPSSRRFLQEVDSLRTWDGKELPSDFKDSIVREYERLRMVEEQISALRKERERRVQSADSPSLRKVTQLRTLYGIGPTSSWDFVMELFSWRNFKNRRELGAFLGLTPTPYDSGGSQREQGISKEGRGRIRALSIQIAWGWLRFQPHSKLTQWYMERFADGGSRMRRIGIVAVARRLLIDLWRYTEYGVIPEGVRIRPVQ